MRITAASTRKRTARHATEADRAVALPSLFGWSRRRRTNERKFLPRKRRGT
jgi:hypothetical protein